MYSVCERGWLIGGWRGARQVSRAPRHQRQPHMTAPRILLTSGFSTRLMVMDNVFTSPPSR